MHTTEVIGLLIIITNIVISYTGFKDVAFYEKYKFDVEGILVHKEYIRLISSGFLHVDWRHLIFNMISLYLFADLIELYLGVTNFLIIYFSSLLGGNLLALFVHRNHGDYSAVGASGSVCGIIFASIALFPEVGIGFLMLPVSMPSWLYGIFFVGISIYGIRSRRDNIGHEAHLGGALVGMVSAIMMHPLLLRYNYLPVLIVLVPTAVFIYLIITKPYVLLVNNNFFSRQQRYYSIEHQYNAHKVNRQKELDQLLDKINKRGFEKLTPEEKQKLEEYSKTAK